MPRRFVSWNVNGIRACVRKGFLDWLPAARADLIGLQETRCEHEDLPGMLHRAARLRGTRTGCRARSRRGYSGVAILSRKAPLAIEAELGDESFDREGRFLLARFADLLVANVYFPKGSGTQRDNSRVPYKLAFTEHVFEAVRRRAARGTGLPAILMGDFNIAPEPIDLARPRGNETTSGFLPEERALLARCMGRGWVDTFRALHPDGVQVQLVEQPDRRPRAQHRLAHRPRAGVGGSGAARPARVHLGPRPRLGPLPGRHRPRRRAALSHRGGLLADIPRAS